MVPDKPTNYRRRRQPGIQDKPLKPRQSLVLALAEVLPKQFFHYSFHSLASQVEVRILTISLYHDQFTLMRPLNIKSRVIPTHASRALK